MRTTSPTHGSRRRAHGAAATACAFIVAMACFALSQGPAFGQEAKQRARVPTSYANVHMGPGSGQQVLVLVPRGTVLPVVGRRGEWVQVQLSPELRKTGMVMRWYKNEDRGWMHDSTVELLDGASQ